MKPFIKLIIIGVLFFLLVSVRFFETALFYDPLLHFYQGDYLTGIAPTFDTLKLILHIFLRYGLNTLLSLLILWVAFRDRKIMNFCVLFYGFAFVFLISLFAYLIFRMAPENYFMLFYVRRFLIQPLFVLLLLPAFYYQKYLR